MSSRTDDAFSTVWPGSGASMPDMDRSASSTIQTQAAKLDFVSSFQMSHPAAFELAKRIAEIAPEGLEHVFFTNSGSESVDTALKIARGYHRARGEASRIRFISRARAYHGMGWGGLSVSGIVRHRRDFGPLLPEVDHLPHTHDPEHAAFSRGQPQWGAHFADELTKLLQIHDPSTIAAVIVEPVTGSGGVLPPPVGYLQRLRSICDQHGILLIFRRGDHRLRPTGCSLRRQRIWRHTRPHHLRQGHDQCHRADGRRHRQRQDL
jgi:beta-alanine--pyruvate transaminase